MIYVIDKESKEHIATVTLPDCTHGGGISYDGTFVWVAKDNERKMSAVLFSELERVIHYGFGSVRYLTTVNVKCQASFTITYGDRMWVGNTFSKTTGTMIGFRVKNVLGIPRLVRDGEIEMPVLAQGAMLADIGDKTYLAISVSGGRVQSRERQSAEARGLQGPRDARTAAHDGGDHHRPRDARGVYSV